MSSTAKPLTVQLGPALDVNHTFVQLIMLNTLPTC